MAGNFPALTLGIWWKRATTTGAICGIIAGWGICLFYLVTSRYFPQAGVTYFGMRLRLAGDFLRDDRHG